MKIVACVTTYNEAGNIAELIKEIRALPLPIEVLVIDDNSPDGTFRIVEELGARDEHVHLLLRKENRGRGWAGIEGFKRALSMGADLILELDADFSHPPKFIPALIEKARDADVVIGSRYIAGGKDEARSLLRRVISAFARRYLSFVLGVRVKDPTSGFRVFTRPIMEKILPHLSARDPFIVTEMLFWSRKYGARMAEVPIEFLPRKSGESKLNASMLIMYLFRVLKLKLTLRQ